VCVCVRGGVVSERSLWQSWIKELHANKYVFVILSENGSRDVCGKPRTTRVYLKQEE